MILLLIGIPVAFCAGLGIGFLILNWAFKQIFRGPWR